MANWFRFDIVNNIVTNNVAGLAGAGMSLQDVANASIVHNSIASNDNTGTAGQAFQPGTPNQSNAQPGAGHCFPSTQCGAEQCGRVGVGGRFGSSFSDPDLANNIVWENRTFFWQVSGPTSFGLVPDIGAGAAPVYDDLAVTAGGGTLTCSSCIFTGDPNPFVNPVANGSRGETIQMPELTTSVATAPGV